MTTHKNRSLAEILNECREVVSSDLPDNAPERAKAYRKWK